MRGDVHTIPVMKGEPEHTQSEMCWCKPRVDREAFPRLVIIHRCLSQPEQNTQTDRVLEL